MLFYLPLFAVAALARTDSAETAQILQTADSWPNLNALKGWLRPQAIQRHTPSMESQEPEVLPRPNHFFHSSGEEDEPVLQPLGDNNGMGEHIYPVKLTAEEAMDIWGKVIKPCLPKMTVFVKRQLYSHFQHEESRTPLAVQHILAQMCKYQQAKVEDQVRAYTSELRDEGVNLGAAWPFLDSSFVTKPTHY